MKRIATLVTVLVHLLPGVVIDETEATNVDLPTRDYDSATTGISSSHDTHKVKSVLVDSQHGSVAVEEEQQKSPHRNNDNDNYNANHDGDFQKRQTAALAMIYGNFECKC
jgi:hypothetical protein